MKKMLLVFLIALPTIIMAAWSDPQDLGAPPNSTSIDECATVSMQNLYMVFASNRTGGSGGEDLWYTEKVGTTWSTPVNLGSNVNTASADITPKLAENDTKLYFSSNTGAGGYGSYDLWVSTFNGGVAGPKVNLGPPVCSASGETCPVLSPNGNTLFFASNRAGGSGNYDIWYSTKSGSTWSLPVNLGNPPNSSSVDEPCWVSDDGNTLVFSSNRTAGSFGSYDLWVTTFADGYWSIPVNMSIPINTTQSEEFACFVCNGGALGGIMYLSRFVTGSNVNIFTSTESSYLLVEPSSIGLIKATFK